MSLEKKMDKILKRRNKIEKQIIVLNEASVEMKKIVIKYENEIEILKQNNKDYKVIEKLYNNALNDLESIETKLAEKVFMFNVYDKVLDDYSQQIEVIE